MNNLLYPIATEKAINMIERNNVITYIVDTRSSKAEIKKEFEERFGVKIAAIRVANTPRNEKKAYIKLAPTSKASEVAMKLKLV